MQEQEPSVTDILSSIRQILSTKIDEDQREDVSQKPDVSFSLAEAESKSEAFEDASVEAPVLPEDEHVDEDVFVLTPQMQLVETVVRHMPEEMLPQGMDVQPLVQAWLDKNLGPMVERIVSEEVRRVFNKK